MIYYTSLCNSLLKGLLWKAKYANNRRLLITENRINEDWLSILTGYTLHVCVLGDHAGGFYSFRDFV